MKSEAKYTRQTLGRRIWLTEEFLSQYNGMGSTELGEFLSDYMEESWPCIVRRGLTGEILAQNMFHCWVEVEE